MKLHSSRRVLWRRIFGVLALLMIAFIFYNSSRTGTASAAVSTPIAQWLRDLFPWMPDLHAVSFILRKSGHLSEFALLGLLVSFYFSAWRMTLPHVCTSTALTCLLVACCDEQLQFFIPGRSAEVRDVWVDFAGVLLGLLVFWVISLLAERRQRRRYGKRPPVLRSERKSFPW